MNMNSASQEKLFDEKKETKNLLTRPFYFLFMYHSKDAKKFGIQNTEQRGIS
jgi:hypothetical protein